MIHDTTCPAQTVELGERSVRAADIAEVADRAYHVRPAPAALERAAASYVYAQDAVRTQEIYGRTTGVGANRTVAIDDIRIHAIGLLRSHATAGGELRSRRRLRAMLTVRLIQLAAGGSGVTPAAMCGIAEMLNRDSLPMVRDFGSIGTGDLPALAAVALALCGDVALQPPLPTELISSPEDLISVLNSNAATIGDASLATTDLSALARAALRVAALTFKAVDGNPQPFENVISLVTPLPGVREVCTRMQTYIADSRTPARVQDPYGLRALPQVHGAFLDKLDRLDDVITAMAAAPAENPLFLPDVAVAHHAGFYAAHLAQALDSLLSATAQAARLSLARLSLLVNPDYTGLAPFLGSGAPGASGVMILEYVAGSAVIRLGALSTPAGMHSVNISRGAEEDASSASLAALQALQAVDIFRMVIACELLAAVRALRMRDRDPGAAFAGLSTAMADADLTGDLDLAQQLLTKL